MHSSGLSSGARINNNNNNGARIALVLGDSRSPWPPPPSQNATERLAFRADTYAYTVAMASLYAHRWCYDLRIYRFLPRRSGGAGVDV